MPIRTELEWAKEICERQGYYVIQQSRVQELYARNAVPDYEWNTLKHQPKFKQFMWEKLMHQIAVKLVGDDTCILRDERDLELAADSTVEPFNGHIFQTRITVIKYG